MTTQTPRKEIHLSPEMTLKDLTPRVAGLLCYLGAWVTGIIFLVLEQKNSFVRFHALQSIIVFAVLSVAGAIFGHLPILGFGLGTAITLLGFCLWLLLMVKANAGIVYKLPWAGDLAEKLALDSLGAGGQSSAPPSPSENYSNTPSQSPVPPGPVAQLAGAPAATAEATSAGPKPAAPLPPAPTASAGGQTFRARYYSYTSRTARVVGSSFVIAWSVALLIFFNFFSQYIAYYQGITAGGQTHWQIYSVVTADLNTWLPILNATLALTILGHLLFIVFDRYLLRQAGRLILGGLSLITVVSLLIIFPFDFNVIPNADASFWAPLVTGGALIVVAVGIAIGLVVRFIKLIVHLAEGNY
jgi:uncharacterized membrane protein